MHHDYYEGDITTASVDSNGVLSSSQAGLRIGVILIGTLGTVANLSELIYLFRSRHPYCCQHLLVNQSAIDGFACLFLALSTIIKQPDSKDSFLNAQIGVWICTLFHSNTLLWVGLAGSVTCRALTAIHLYVFTRQKAVHLKLNRIWVKYLTVAFIWIEGAAMNSPFQLTTYVKDGICYLGGVWTDTRGHLAYGIFTALWMYFIPLVICGFCYGNLLVTRHATVSPATHASETVGGIIELDSGEEQHHWKVRAVNALLFGALWGPCYVNLLFWSRDTLFGQLEDTYVSSLCIGYVSLTVGPVLRVLSYCNWAQQRWALFLVRFRKPESNTG